MKLSIHKEFWPASRPFRIAGRVWTSFDAVIVEIADGDAVGRGEGIGVFYLGDTLEGLETQLLSLGNPQPMLCSERSHRSERPTRCH